MNVVSLLFYAFMSTAAFGALAILFSRDVFKSAIYLLITLISVAALYALTYAEFLAVAQILIYAGGIAVLIIFGVMLTTRINGRPLSVQNKHLFSGAIVAVGLFILIIQYLPDAPVSGKNLTPDGISPFAMTVFSRYTLPFELAGILLLVSLVGAAVITSHLKPKT